MAFQFIEIQGNLISLEVIEHIDEKKGQKPKDFGFKKRGQSIMDMISRVWSQTRWLYDEFEKRWAEIGLADTSRTRKNLVLPILEDLGFHPVYHTKAYEIDGRKFPISHRMDEHESSPPIHIVGWEKDLDERENRSRFSPYMLLQEFLNRSEHLWGIVTNGRIFRIVRRTEALTRKSYIEFKLQDMIKNEAFNEFILFFRLIHRTRFPETVDQASECLLESYYQKTIDQGSRIRDKLRDAVHNAIISLANGFLTHPENDELRRDILDGKFSEHDMYHELLILIYRFLFLLVTEQRGILTHNPIYKTYYSLWRFADLALYPPADAHRYSDMYESLKTLFFLVREEELKDRIDLPELNGELFSSDQMQHLEKAHLSNETFLKALRALMWYRPDKDKPLRKVNYAGLDVEELGSVYESLLDNQPLFLINGRPYESTQFAIHGETGRSEDMQKMGETLRHADIEFAFAPGTERKSTGSYYTPKELVNELIRSALEPLLYERVPELKNEHIEKNEILARKLLQLKVLDPACGSGHFLLAAGRRIAREVARLRTGEDEPSTSAYRTALRDVITHCLYGIDKNPLAVELCKVALWLEGHMAGKPLTFLDHHIKCGDSLIGVFDLKVLEKGIPDDAFKPVTGDDKTIAREFRQQNKKERNVQILRPEFETEDLLKSFAREIENIESIPDDTPEHIHQKRTAYDNFRKSPLFLKLKRACDAWTSAFFVPLTPHNIRRIPTTATIRNLLLDVTHSSRPHTTPMVAEKPETYDIEVDNEWETFAQKYRFFHWPLEFPDVFANGGFDLVLSNPPWDQVQVNEKEFFKNKDDYIISLKGAKRKKAINDLKNKNFELFMEWQYYIQNIEQYNKYFVYSNRFPFLRGKKNLYNLFAQLIINIISENGYSGIILPTNIVTDDSNKLLFKYMVTSNRLVSLFDFENKKIFFPDIHSSYKFSLLTIRGQQPIEKRKETPASFAFFLHHPSEMRDPLRVFELSAEDFARINPNTRTCPVFRTRIDAELTKYIYERVPVLINERTGENPWNISFRQGLFNMTSDSHLFRTRSELESAGYRLIGNRFVCGDDIWLPLYEAKMIWLYDHRFGTYEGVSSRSNTHLPTPNDEQHANPSYLVQPWYWVSAKEVEARLGDWDRGWLLVFRDVARSTDERTAIFSILPRVGVGHTSPIVFLFQYLLFVCCVYANVSSLIFDFVTRQKIGGTHLTYNYLKQLPVLTVSLYKKEDLLFIIPRVLELVYTSWDMMPFAEELWKELGDSGVVSRELGFEIRERIVKQWEECCGITLAQFLSGVRRLEGSHEPRRNVLSPDDILSAGRKIQAHISDTESPRVHSIQYNRGAWPGESEKLHTILENIARFLERTRDPSSDIHSRQPRSEGTDPTSPPSMHPRRQDPEIPHPRSPEKGARTPDSPFLTPNSRLPTLLLTSPDAPLPIPPFRWDPERRARIMAELDAYYARLYGLNRKQLRYILDPADLTPRELRDILDPWEEVDDPLDEAGYQYRVEHSTFPGETFRVLKNKEIKKYGFYRTRHLILTAWQNLKDFDT